MMRSLQTPSVLRGIGLEVVVPEINGVYVLSAVAEPEGSYGVGVLFQRQPSDNPVFLFRVAGSLAEAEQLQLSWSSMFTEEIRGSFGVSATVLRQSSVGDPLRALTFTLHDVAVDASFTSTMAVVRHG